MLRSASALLARAAPDGVPVARTLVRAGLARVFGPPTFDPASHAGDPGLVGPDSASWRIVAEPASLVAGVRALLVQLLHPHAMAGVADHSRFRDDPLGRLHGTSAWVTTTTFGATPEALAVTAAVRSLHRTVRGVAPDGRPYRADDPHLLAWVSLALTSSFLAADRAYALRPADAATRDRFVAEQSRVAALLDPRVDLARLRRDPTAQAALRAGALDLPMLAEGSLPTTDEALQLRLADYAPELGVDAAGREALRFLRWPALSPAVKAGYLPLLAGAVATLEPAHRRLLGLSAAGPVTWPLLAQTRALLTAFRLVTGASPSRSAAQRRIVDSEGGRGP